MRTTRLVNLRLLALLSLILLAGNVFAPFHVSDSERPLLLGRSHTMVRHSVFRVRAISPASALTGHRAVVGLAAGGRDLVENRARRDAFSPFLITPADTRRDQSPPPGRSPSPPLRC